MATATSPITDTQLLELVQKSAISEEQKNELKTLLPQMNPDEKAELIAVLQNTGGTTENPQETIKKAKTIARDMAAKARKEFEALEAEETQASVTSMEGAIQQMDAPIKTMEAPTHKKGGAFKFILFMLILAGIAFGTWYALQTL